jgi:shikimate kinase
MIFLIGMPSAGKTYWGKEISQQYQLPYVNLDDFITEQENKSIHDIFSGFGETGFREIEHKVLVGLVHESKKLVVACGGGTPIYKDNLQIMKQAGCVIYMKAEVVTLVHRISNEPINERPLLNTAMNLDIQLQAMLNEREVFYGQADYILQVEKLSVHDFERIITSCINKH